MKLSVKSDYATRAVLELARHFPNETALRVEQLAAAQGVPANYLVQILLELKAKGIANGLPLGAIVARADVMDWPPGSHASTFGGNPVACASALATLRLVEGRYMANARRRG